MRQKVIHVDVGVFGKRWCGDFLKANVDDGTIEVVALVDVDPQALAFGRSALGLRRGLPARSPARPRNSTLGPAWCPRHGWLARCNRRPVLVFGNGRSRDAAVSRFDSGVFSAPRRGVYVTPGFASAF